MRDSKCAPKRGGGHVAGSGRKRAEGVQARKFVALLLVFLMTGGGLEAKTRKGDRFLKEGRAAEAQKNYDQALAMYEKAASEDPSDTEYILSVRRMRFTAGEAHVNAGQALRGEGKLDAALAEFEKAAAIDPSSLIAESEIARTNEMIEREKRLAAQPGAKPRTSAERAMTPAEEARQETGKRIAEMMSAPELRPISRQITTLKMNNQPPKVLFETVGKLAGINVIFDPDFTAGGAAKNFSVDLTNITLEEALDYLAVLTKTFWKPLSDNTIFVAQDQPQKRRDYEDYEVKTFYLNNVQTTQELSEIATAVRAVTDIRRLFQYNAQKAILVRGTVDQVNLAEKLIRDLDKPKGEVVVDVVVMEVNRTKSRTLGGSITSGTTNGLQVGVGPVASSTPGASNGSGTAAAGASNAGSVLLSDIFRLGSRDFAMTLPGYALNAVMTDSATKVVQSPQVRAVDGIKASLRIGDRVPTATGSFQPGIGAVGVSPLVNTQFQFIEVGVNVDMTAYVHSYNEVSLHIELEISQVRDHVDIGGISQPIIGQRKVAHDLRLKEGQATLLGGMMMNQDSNNISGTPGLANIPLLKYLFSVNTHSTSNQELVIALVPHIVRAPELTLENLKGVAAGNDQVVRLTYGEPLEERRTAAVAAANSPATPVSAAAPTLPGVPVMPPAGQTAPAVPAAPATPTAPHTPPLPGVPAAPPPVVPAAPPSSSGPARTTTPPAPGAPAAAERPLVHFNRRSITAPSEPGAGSEAAAPHVQGAPAAAEGPVVLFNTPALTVPTAASRTVTLQIQNVNDLFSAPIRIHFDPKVIQIEEIRQGNMMAGAGGQRVIFTRNIRNDAGEASVNLSRLPGSGGASGSGDLLNITVTGVAPGTAKLTAEAPLQNSQMQPISPARVSDLTVTVK